jgi:hypothetical protein
VRPEGLGKFKNAPHRVSNLRCSLNIIIIIVAIDIIFHFESTERVLPQMVYVLLFLRSLSGADNFSECIVVLKALVCEQSLTISAVSGAR